VIPEFYARGEKGIPAAWVARMRESMACLTPRFAASRTVTEYTEEHYLPAATAYRARAADKGAAARKLVDGRNALGSKWAALRFGDVKIDSAGDQHVFAVQVFLNGIDPATVRVELYAEGNNDHPAVRQEMTRLQAPAGPVDGSVYGASVSSDRPAGDYTPRVISQFPQVAVPLEAGQILWQR